MRSLQKNSWAALSKLRRLSPMRPLHMPLVTLTVVARRVPVAGATPAYEERQFGTMLAMWTVL